MKRFYRKVEVADAEAGHRVLLDGRPLRTPAKRLLACRRRPGRGDRGRVAGAGRDRPARGHAADPPRQHREGPHARLRAAAIEEVVGYAGTDLLCYRAAAPFDLVERQQRVWQPLLEWAGTYGVRLTS